MNSSPSLAEMGAAFALLAAALTALAALFLAWRLRLRVRQLHAAHGQAHAALERLRVTLAATGASIWEHDCATGAETHDAGWYRMLGYEPPSTPTDAYAEWRSLVHPDDLPQAETAFRQFLEDPTQGRYTSQFRMRAADGSWHWVLSFGQALERDAAGRPTRVVGIHLDIHEQEATRQQLVHSELRLRAILHHVPMAFGLFRRTPDGFIIEDYNPAAGQTMGIDVADVLGRPLLEAFPRLAQTAVPEMLAATVDHGTPMVQEAHPYINRLGQQRFYTVIAFPVPPDLVGVFFRDVTEQRHAQQETEDALRLFTAVFHLSPEGLALVDSSGRILHANAEFARLAHGQGTVPETIDGAPFFSPALCEELRATVIQQHQPLRREMEGTRTDGSRAPLALTARPLTLHGEEHILLALRDMTEHHRIQELLVQTEKMLSLGGIAAGIAHEINNPLGIILQSAQNAELRLRPDFPKNRQVAESLGVNMDDVTRYLEARGIPGFLADIREAGGRAAGIVRTMLDFGRKSESKRALGAVHDMIENALALASKDYDLKKHYDFRHIAIERDFADGLPPVFVTQTEIEQVLLNLLRNAAHALHEAPPAEGARIRITTRAEAGTVRVTVADNGPGIAPDVLPRIFEPFFTTKPPGLGTGLGLAVSYFIAQNHGGRLWAESTPGQGAVFHLELPAAPSSAT